MYMLFHTGQQPDVSWSVTEGRSTQDVVFGVFNAIATVIALSLKPGLELK
jgi:hypothetical protein